MRTNLTGIYAIENKLNGKIYVGLSKDIIRRWAAHLRMLENSSHHSFELQSDWDELGIKHFSFRILEICDEAKLKNREEFWVHKYSAETVGYNMTSMQIPPEYLLEENKRLKEELEVLKNGEIVTKQTMRIGENNTVNMNSLLNLRQYQHLKRAAVDMNKNIEEEKSNKQKDELYIEAQSLIFRSGNASVSFLQRKLRIGYARAARLIDMLEEKGVIGSYNGSKAREILIRKDE